MLDSQILHGPADGLRRLLERTREAAPGRIQLVAGPRQVGKTTLLLELHRALAPHATYGAADGPEAELPGWWDRLWDDAEEMAKHDGRSIVLLDEIQRVDDWARKLKGRWDRIRRRKLPLHVIATGSSALHLATGSRETLAGRFERMVLSHWSARTLSQVFDIPPGHAVDDVVQWGAYPGAIHMASDPARRRAYIRDAIIEPAIGRDLLGIHPVRRPALLRQVFAVATSAPAQIVSLQKLQGQLQDKGALETIANYLHLLEDAFLVAALEKHSARAIRQRAAPPKLLVLSNAILAALDPQGPPSRAADPARFGAWVENACLAHAWNAGQSVKYWREEPLEVDAVLEGSWGTWAVEVKTGPYLARDLTGLLEFTRRFPAYRPLVLCDEGNEQIAERLGVKSIAWRRYLAGEALG